MYTAKHLVIYACLALFVRWCIARIYAFMEGLDKRELKFPKTFLYFYNLGVKVGVLTETKKQIKQIMSDEKENKIPADLFIDIDDVPDDDTIGRVYFEPDSES